jgi:hypothetical protein
MTRLYLLALREPVLHRCVVDIEAEVARPEDGDAAVRTPRRRCRQAGG